MLPDRRTRQRREPVGGPTVIVKVYNSVDEYNGDVKRMVADGWTVHYQPIRSDTVVHMGRKAAKVALIGAVGTAISGRSKRPHEITVTYVRQDWRSTQVRKVGDRSRGPGDLTTLGEPGGGAVSEPGQRVQGGEGNRWVKALYTISDAVFLISVVVVGLLMTIQAPWFGVPLVASGIVVVYRVVHGVKSPWL